MRRNPRQLPALRAEMAAAAALATPAVYPDFFFVPAFFFVPEKGSKGVGNAVIPTLPMHWSHGLQHLRHKRPTFAFTGESGYTLSFAQRIAHKGLHAETGGHPCVVARSIWLRPHHSKNSRRKRLHAYGVCPLPPAPRPRWAVGTYSFVTAWSFLHRYQSANSWNFQSRLLDAPTSIAKPSVFCYNILKSR